MLAAANTDGPEKAIAAVQHIVESPVASASAEEDTVLGHDLHLSTNPDPTDERSESKVRLDAAEKVILRSDPSILSSLIGVSDGKYLSGGGVDGDVRGHATSLLKTAMSRLGKEFRQMISVHSTKLDPDHRSFQSLSLSTPSENSDLTTEDVSTSMEEQQHAAEERRWYSLSDDQKSIPSEVISDVKEIADRMITAGYHQELSQAYCSARQDFLNEFPSVLGVDRSSIENTQMIEWETLYQKASEWTRRLNFLVRVVLPTERELCNHIFEASDELKEGSFRKATKCFVLQLLNLGDVIATKLRSLNGVFLMLAIYEALSDLQAVFLGDSEEFICWEVEQVIERLGKMVGGTLAEFEDAIRSKNLSKPRQSGQIDPMVRYVMNYIKVLVFYSSSLNLLLHDDGVDDGDNSVDGESVTPFGQRMHLFISCLECRIQEISKFYKDDDALKYIFLMNNVLCMVHKVEDSELKALLGDNWVCTRRRQIQQYATCYLSASWSKPLFCLKIDGLFRGGDFIVALKVKERFKLFNFTFVEIWSKQRAWIVPDPQLRDDLRLLISTTLIPGYRSFVERFQPLLERGQRPSEYIYTPEDLENYLWDLFEGKPNTSNHLRRKLVSL